VAAREVITKTQTSRKEPFLSFFDEGDEPRTAIRSPQPPPRRPQARSRRGSADDRTLLLRRAGAALIVLLVVIGIVFAVKAVLNHQALQSLKTYNSNVGIIVGNEQASVRGQFFRELDGAYSSSNPAEVPTTLQQYVSIEAGYYHQAEGWSVPAQMVSAQRYFVEALGFRYQALQDIEAQMTSALGANADQTLAIKLIAGQMENLLTADTIYKERVKPLIQQALVNAGISGQTTPDSVFLPDIGWLQPQTVALRILGFVPASLGGLPASGSPGHALEGVSVQGLTSTPTALSTTGLNRLAYTSAGITFVLNVLNSGTLTEYAVNTKIFFTKVGLHTGCLTQTGVIRKTVPGSSYLSSIVWAPSTCTNLSSFLNIPLYLHAEVDPLPGETDTKNNYMQFLVEFTH
jgi:hypothetical protein